MLEEDYFFWKIQDLKSKHLQDNKQQENHCGEKDFANSIILSKICLFYLSVFLFDWSILLEFWDIWIIVLVQWNISSDTNTNWGTEVIFLLVIYVLSSSNNSLGGRDRGSEGEREGEGGSEGERERESHRDLVEQNQGPHSVTSIGKIERQLLWVTKLHEKAKANGQYFMKLLTAIGCAIFLSSVLEYFSWHWPPNIKEGKKT